MADESDRFETLFSFEVMVEYVQIHKTGTEQRNLVPAVGVRLLDFPTLLIHQGAHEVSPRQDDSDSEKENTKTPDLLLNPNDCTSEYSFRKGKSCLFKINLDLLHTHLCNVPLYAMVLDLRNEIPKFVGSCMVSVAKVIDRIKADVRNHGICTPSSQGERGLFAICNLMGEKIGCISLGYKLLSLGASLIPHIPQNRVLQIGSAQTTEKQPLKPSDHFKEINRCSHENVQVASSHRPEVQSSNMLCQKIELDGQQTEIVVSETEAKSVSVVSAGTQTEYARRRVKTVEVEEIAFDNERNSDIFCPPPLYYSCSEKKQEHHDADGYRWVHVGMEALRVEDLHSEEEACEEECGLPAKPRGAMHPEDEATSSRTVQQTQAAAPLREALRRLPLLSALLAEVTELTSQPQQLPLSVHPDLARLYGPSAERLRGVSPDARPRPQAHSTRTSPTPRGKRSPSPHLQHKSLATSEGSFSTSPKESGKVKRQNPKQEKTPPKSPPRRKLAYGLTNTVRLRLQQTNPTVLKEHERREQHRRKQVELLKRISRRPQAQSRTKRGQKLNVSRGEVLNRRVSLDENVQTLVNSTDFGSPRMTNPSSQARSERGSGSRVGKSSDSDVCLPTRGAHDPVSQSIPKRTLSVCPKNRNVQVHIPSALSQYSDHADDDVAQSDASYTQPQTTNPVFHSTSEEEGRSPESSRYSSPVQRYSDSYRDSVEPVEYLDDFTSLEPTDGHSLEFHSSPEPALGSFRKGASGSDSASQRSQRTALPVPVPVKAGASPQRSLKGTHIIRPRRQASAISVSSGESEIASTSVGSIPSRDRRRSRAGGGDADRSSVCKDTEGSGSQMSDRYEDSPPAKGSPVDSHLPTNNSEPVSSPSPVLELDEEMRDELGSLGFDNKYRHISELMVNKLPGYTL